MKRTIKPLLFAIFISTIFFPKTQGQDCQMIKELGIVSSTNCNIKLATLVASFDQTRNGYYSFILRGLGCYLQLNLQQNWLTSVSIITAHETGVANIQTTGQADIDLVMFNRFDIIDLSGNELESTESIRISGLPILDVLFLYNNKIRSIDRVDTIQAPALRNLNMADNLISSVANSTFEGVPNLLYLNLNDNLISDISEISIGGVKTLFNLHLSYNHI